MKRWLIGIMCVFLLLLTGCNSAKEEVSMYASEEDAYELALTAVDHLYHYEYYMDMEFDSNDPMGIRNHMVQILEPLYEHADTTVYTDLDGFVDSVGAFVSVDFYGPLVVYQYVNGYEMTSLTLIESSEEIDNEYDELPYLYQTYEWKYTYDTKEGPQDLVDTIMVQITNTEEGPKLKYIGVSSQGKEGIQKISMDAMSYVAP